MSFGVVMGAGDAAGAVSVVFSGGEFGGFNGYWVVYRFHPFCHCATHDFTSF